MDRIEELINKLKEQFDKKTDPAHLLGTIQLLQFELTKLKSNGTQSLGTAKVAVILPSTNIVTASVVQVEKFAPKPAEVVVVNEIPVPKVVDNTFAPPPQKKLQSEVSFDPMLEYPTLSHQPKEREVNDASIQTESLNDRLKQAKTELSESLKESPVKDLRVAIGVNDRFLFINELFRGDETMYERSIKTINGFATYAEAEYWISRELKVKLAWHNNHPTVQHFDQLVKRRFS
jgi:hypothetical protein